MLLFNTYLDFFRPFNNFLIDLDVRVSPVQFPQQHSPQYYRQSGEESIKSESPSRKRRRLSRSGLHIELNAQPASPPRRSPRQHPPSTPHRAMQVSFIFTTK